MSSGAENSKLRQIVGKLARVVDPRPRLKYYYGHYYKHAHVQPRTILFESFHGKTVSDSPLALLVELLAREECRDFKIYYASDNVPEHKRLIEAQGLPVELVDINSRSYVRALATCQYLVNNSSFPSFFIRREGQSYLQTWHGTPLKTLGKRMRLGIESMHNVQHNYLQASHAIFPNEYTRDAIMGDYNLESLYTGKLALCGYPRNSIFFDKRAAAQTRSARNLEGCECFAYMPTWRGTSNHDIRIGEYAEDLLARLKLLDEQLLDNQRLFVNLHPLVAKEIDLGGFERVLPFPEDVDSYEFLNTMDALVTDYSSVFFDYSVTGKPVILFTYDIDEYLTDRGLYLDIESLPFKRVNTTEELAGLLVSGAYKECSPLTPEYRERFLKYEHPENPRRALDFLFDNDTCGLEVCDYARNASRSWEAVRVSKQGSVKELEAICEAVDPGTQIAVFDRYAFDQEKSAFLYDNYRDSFNFLFATKAVPRTPIEEIGMRVSESVAERIEHRDTLRLFGGLHITRTVRTLPGGAGGSGASCRLRSIRAGEAGTLRARIECPQHSAPLEVQLVYRSSTESLACPLPHSAKRTRRGWLLSVTIDTSTLPLKEVYWDLLVIATGNDEPQHLKVKVPKPVAGMLALRNVQALDPSGNILFPYVSSGYRLTFTYRAPYPTDTMRYKLKELAALGTYFLLRPMWDRKRVWLVFEKFCTTAQDNGYYFFKWCMDELPAEERKHIYFILDGDSPDCANVSSYKRNVIRRFSFKHILYSLACNICIASDCKSHLYVWRPKPNLVNALIRRKKIFFLQHGVTALKRVHPIFGKQGTNPMSYFLTTSAAEQRIVVENFGYGAEEAPVLGFSRWDVLRDCADRENPTILVMPTWRPWLEGQTPERFKESAFYEHYSQLLGDPRLLRTLEEHRATLKFYIHPKLSELIGSFNSGSSRVEFVRQGSVQLNELLMESTLLVTDYSSVCWDMLYMGKPVIFNQFDLDSYEQAVGSYLDLRRDLPGPVCESIDELVSAIEGYLCNGMALHEEDERKAQAWFENRDDRNRERTYRFIKSQGF